MLTMHSAQSKTPKIESRIMRTLATITGITLTLTLALLVGMSAAQAAPGHPATSRAGTVTTDLYRLPYDDGYQAVIAGTPTATCIHVSNTQYIVLYSMGTDLHLDSMGTDLHLAPTSTVMRHRLASDVIVNPDGDAVGRQLAAGVVSVAPGSAPAC